ncbi:hypothetical protein SDJN02_01234, partial [Cucurbita argyrosperma subsp. argyrosperma]
AIGGRESRIIERSFWPRLGDEKQREGKNAAVALDEVIAGAKLKQLVLSLWPVGLWHLLGRLMEMEDVDEDNKVEVILQGIQLRLLLSTLHHVSNFLLDIMNYHICDCNDMVLIRLGY